MPAPHPSIPVIEPSPDGAGGPAYGPLIEALRTATDVISSADAPAALLAKATAGLASITDLLAPYEVAPGPIPAGHRWDLPTRGHPLLIPFHIETRHATAMRGRVRLDRRHTGNSGGAHGGFLPLLFDEVLGTFPSRLDPPAQTVSLTVDYRRPTPIGVDLAVWAEVERFEGRKMWVRGGLELDETTVVEARGLFVQPHG